MMADIFVESHHKQVLNQLKDWWKDDLFCDVTLLADGGGTRIPAHRNVLAASSGYFHDKFTESLPEGTDNEVVLEQVDGATLKLMLTYCYSGALKVDQTDAADLCKAANELQLDTLRNELSKPEIIDGSMGDIYVESHHEQVFIKLRELWENNMFCDATLIVGDDEETRIPVHRNVVSANSVFFRDFYKIYVETTENKLVCIEGSILKELVTYCYSGAIKVEDSGHAIAICQKADYLQMDTLLHKLSANIIDESNYFDMYNLPSMRKAVISYIEDHFLELSEGPQFLQFTVYWLESFFSSVKLNVIFEKNLFDCLERWISHDDAERRQHFTTLLALIKLPKMPLDFLLAEVEPHCDTIESQQLVTAAKELLTLGSTDLETPPHWQEERHSQTSLVMVKQSLDALSDTHIMEFHSATQQWVKIGETSNPDIDYDVCYSNGKLYFGGDGDFAVEDIRVFDLRTRNFTNIAPPSKQRTGTNLIAFNQGLFIVGESNNEGIFGDCERFDFVTSEWMNAAALPVEYRESGLAVIDGRLYCTNIKTRDNVVYVYDHEANDWQVDQQIEMRSSDIDESTEGLYIIEQFTLQTNAETVAYNARSCWKKTYRTVYKSKLLEFTEEGRVNIFNEKTRVFDEYTNHELGNFTANDLFYGVFTIPSRLLSDERN